MFYHLTRSCWFDKIVVVGQKNERKQIMTTIKKYLTFVDNYLDGFIENILSQERNNIATTTAEDNIARGYYLSKKMLKNEKLITQIRLKHLNSSLMDAIWQNCWDRTENEYDTFDDSVFSILRGLNNIFNNCPRSFFGEFNTSILETYLSDVYIQNILEGEEEDNQYIEAELQYCIETFCTLISEFFQGRSNLSDSLKKETLK